MTIETITNGTTVIWKPKGRLDTATAPALETLIDGIGTAVKTLVLDLGELEYLSSAGLRVLLIAQKRMNGQGELVLRHVNETVMEIFEITGFSDILTIEQG